MKAKLRAKDAKMKELILHVASLCQDDQNFGAVKLNKILFFADFLMYLKRGNSITEQEYFAIDEGPAPRRLLPIRDGLISSGAVALQKTDFHGFTQERIVVLKQVEYKHLSAEEVAMADWVINRFRDMNGTELTNWSHGFIGWKIAFKEGPRTTIPYSIARFHSEFFGIQTPRLPQSLIEYGQKLWNNLEPNRQASCV